MLREKFPQKNYTLQILSLSSYQSRVSIFVSVAIRRAVEIEVGENFATNVLRNQSPVRRRKE